jgi:hypothetical protein
MKVKGKEDPPIAPAAAAPPSTRGTRVVVRRGARMVEFILIIAIGFVILSLLKLEPLARNSVQNHNSAIEQRLRRIEDGNSIINGGVGTVKICPSALKLFANKTELELAIQKNVHYHQHGGNLHSIEQYLNSHMQSTLDRLGVEFSSKDDLNKPVPNAIEHLNEYYKKNQVARGGYGQPLPGKLSSPSSGNKIFRQALFEKRWINVIEPSTSQRFFAGIGPVGPNCSEPVSFSKGTYEEKNICVETKKKTHDNGEGGERNDNNDDVDDNMECHIVSIGSNDQWGFEEEVMNTPQLRGCVTHTFDCTLHNNNPKRKPQNDNVKFYPYCIGSEGQQPPYLPFHQMWNLTQTKQAPKFLKMDVEGFEYHVVLNSILSSDSSIWPEQIMMEIHWATRMVDLAWMPRTRTAAELALFFGVLFNRGGYILQQAKYFPGCETCLEVLLVRAVC